MKKRVIAMVCTLALVLGVCAAVLTIDVNAATKTFEVGYSRVDINPWVDINDHSKGILQLPLRGNGNTMNRQSVPELIDDNGDGLIKTDGSDGLFAACIAVTDDDGDTVLIYSVAIIGGFERMVDDARAGLLAALKEKGIDVKLSAQDIQIQGTHTHNSIDLTQYVESFKDSTYTYKLQDQNGDLTDATITRGEVYNNFTVWYPYLIDQLVAAGVEAIEDRATATMSKGQIDAGDSNAAEGKVMNTVRHYTRVSSTTDEVYVRGSNFNGSNISYKSAGDGSVSSANMASGSAELAEANDTMYCLKFTFANGNNPIALVNWRAHTTQADRDGTRLNVSSCYVNRMSYELSKVANGGYRAIFIQGAAGNVNPSSAIYGGWCGSTVHKDANSDGLWKGDELSGNIYGGVLGKVAAECLNNNMNVVDAGDIKVTNMVFNSVAKTYEEEIMYQAAKTVSTYGNQSVKYPFIYPLHVTQDIYNALTEEQQGWYNSYTGSSTYKALSADTYTGTTYALASRFHTSDVIANYQETGKQALDVTAFLLGENVAFVTAPGEMYDRYNSNVTWEQLKDKTQQEIYNILSATNEWDKLLSENIGGSYGTPFVMGYANRHIGYLPNYIAYEYSKGSKIAAIGAYESHNAEMAQGECEQLLDVYAGMLGSLVSDQLPEGGLYRTAYCEACKTTVNWSPISEDYNNLGGAPGLAGGHYYLLADTTGDQKNIMDGNTVCLDLNGHTITGNTRAFILSGSGGEILNIMDSSQAGTGKVQGYGASVTTGKTPFGGGTIYVSAGNTCNLYSGTLTQAKTDTSGVAYGGVVEVRYEDAVFNMYGGTITGGKVTWTGLNDGTAAVSLYGGNVYVYGGTFNMYDGVISDGIAQAYVVETLDEGGNVTATKNNTAYGGNIFVRAVSHTAADSSTYYSGNFNMYGGSITGGQSISYTNQAGSATANGYGGSISVGANANLNLYGGSITGGSAGYLGNCVYMSESGYATLSGDACVDQIYSYKTGTANVTVSGLYTGSAQIRSRSNPAASGTVVATSDNAVLNTTGLTTRNDYTLVVSGDDIVTGSTVTCACGETVVMNNLTQKLWDAYGGDLPSAHYKLTGDITAQLDPDGVELKNNVCLDLAGHDISVTTGRLYAIADGGKLEIYDSVGGGQIVTAGLPSGVTSSYGGLFRVDAGGTLELNGGTLTMAQSSGHTYATRGGIVYVEGIFAMSGGTVKDGKCNKPNTNCYGGNIAINAGGVMNMSGGSVENGYAFSGDTSYEGAGGNVQIFKDGTLNMSGGSMTGGTTEADKYGPCIRQSPNSKVVLSGDASVEELSYRTGCLDISGNYTGTTVLRLASGTPAQGDILGASIDANIDNADITIYNSDLNVYVAGSSLVLSKETTCAGCSQTAVWLPLSVTDSATWTTGLSSGHYYLDAEEVAVPKNMNIPADTTVCIDLRGNNITAAANRLFYIFGTLHLIDTVGDGVAKGHGGTAPSWGGGTALVNSGGKFYLHSGNLTQGVSDTHKANSGGVVLSNGEFYMSGGAIYGGVATGGYGGNVYIKSGSAYISGGSVTGGTAGTAGNCVYVASGRSLTLSGNANVDEICFGGSSGETFTISGAYTGTTTLKLASSVVAEAGTVIGISDSAALGGATISVAGSQLLPRVSGEDIVLYDPNGGAIIKDENGNRIGAYSSFQEAVGAYQGTNETLVLASNVDTAVTVSQDMVIDLDGYKVNAAITTENGAKLYFADSQTADYSAEDGIFTKLPASMAETALAAEGYVKYTHEDDTVSFHKLDTTVEYINFRPEDAGLYYSSLFMGDEYAAKEVKTFGVALSIKGTPVTETGFADHAQHTTFDGSLFEPSTVTEFASTILVDVLHADYGTIQNRINGETVVYGCSYIQLMDGSYVISNEGQVTLRAVVEYVSNNWNDYTSFHDEILAMYEKFPAVLNRWDIDTITQAYEESK